MSPIALYIFALCFAGHVFGDFILQTEAIALGKRTEWKMLGVHIGQHVLATALMLLLGWTRLARAAPGAFPTLGELAVIVIAIAVTHTVVDKVKIGADMRWGSQPMFFVLDQIAHVLVLTGVVTWVAGRHGDWQLDAPNPVFVLGQPLTVHTVATGLLFFFATVLAIRGGAILNWLVSAPLMRKATDSTVAESGLPANMLADTPRLYRGYLDRLSLCVFALAGWWWAFVLFVIGRVLWLYNANQPRPALTWQVDLAHLVTSVLTAGTVGVWALVISA